LLLGIGQFIGYLLDGPSLTLSQRNLAQSPLTTLQTSYNETEQLSHVQKMITKTEQHTEENGPKPITDLRNNLSGLFAAMAKAQLQVRSVSKDGSNPHFRSSYVTLDSILAGPVKVFNQHGIAIMQLPSLADNRISVRTVLAHANGANIQSDLSLPCDLNNPHKVGSTLTYLKRFSLTSILGIPGEEDDDGNAAAGVSSRPNGKLNRKPIVTARKVPRQDEAKFNLDSF
jgi:hypothetical protein